MYCNTENWGTFIGQKLTFLREFNHAHDKFPLAGQTLLPGKLAPRTVEHITREISRYLWFALQRNATITADVQDEKARRSPLVQGGLEIVIRTIVFWNNINNMDILRQKIESVNFQEYNDESRDILRELEAVIGDEEDDEEI